MSDPIYFCKKRMNHLKQFMNEKNIDLVCLVKDRKRRQQYNLNKRLANTPFGSALFILLDENPVLLCTPDEAIDASDESWVEVQEIRSQENLDSAIINFINEKMKNENSKIGINLSVLTYTTYLYIKNNLKGELLNIESTILPEVFFGLYPGEIKFQRKASKLADIAITAIRESLAPGRRECEIAAEAAYAMMSHGAESLKFHTIVGSGKRSAYIHSWPGDKKIKKGDLVLVDLGPIKDGYTADISRTFLVGKDDKKEKMLNAVDKAIEMVLKNIKPGTSCRELDAISRRILQENGYPDFPHGMGHPLSGFVVPTLSKDSQDIEKIGMLHTIEPGVYLIGYGGVRFEENIVIKDNGFELLTKSPRII